MALFLLSQVFLIVSHGPLVHTLASIILKSTTESVKKGASWSLEQYGEITPEFAPPKESLEKSLENLNDADSGRGEASGESVCSQPISNGNTCDESDTEKSGDQTLNGATRLNITDEEKEQRLALESPLTLQQNGKATSPGLLADKPFLETILNSLSCTENDYAPLFALCLVYALASNEVTCVLTNNNYTMIYY